MLTPSVTQCISPFVDFSKISPDVLLHASERGTRAHDACAAYAMMLHVVIDPDIQGYFDSYRRWFDMMNEEVLLCEDRLIEKDFLFHGQCDLVIKSNSEGVILVDLKTPVQLQKSWQLQISAYKHLVENVAMIRMDKVGSLQLNKDGKTAHMIYYENSAQDFNLFLQCLNLYRFFYSK